MHSLQRMLLVHNYLSSIRYEVDTDLVMGYSLEAKPLHQPEYEEVCKVLEKGLTEYFETVTVQVAECPDLKQPPFSFPARGICGNPTLVEVGGPPFLLPEVKRDKVYDFRDIQKMVKIEPAFIIGAGAGPFPYTGVNCEGIYSLMIKDSFVKQTSKISKVNFATGKSDQENLPQNETRFALLANLLISEGEGGEVLKVHVKKRIGCHDFITSIRNCLADAFDHDIVGLGGTFIMKKGYFKQHVMPDFPKEPLKSDEDLNMWLQFYNMSAPLVAVGTLITGDYDLDLRLQHFHSFSDHNEAGHYHEDTTPDIVEYLGYFSIAKTVIRIDKPPESHNMGRD